MTTTRHPTPLRRLTGMLDLPRRRLIAAIVAATTTLAAAFALAAVSAWLITTAWTMPPVLDLTVAVVGVRALGVSRGAFRWVDRMLTHDVALRGVVSLRTNLFTALARRRGDALSRLRRGDLLARLGDDAQELGDHVIRAIVPAVVAGVMGVVVIATIAPLNLWAAGAMLASLLIAGVLAPTAAYRAARLTESAVIGSRARVSATVMETLDDADAIRLQGRLDAQIDELGRRQHAHDAAIDRAALPAAIASATVPMVMILAVLGSVLAAGDAWLTGTISAGVAGILLLLPLSSFEAVTALPAAASQLARSRAAAARLDDVMGPEGTRPPGNAEPTRDHPAAELPAVPALTAHGLDAGFTADAPRIRRLDLDLAPGSRLAVLGASGVGKSTLLLTLAGLLDPLRGSVQLDGRPIGELGRDDLTEHVVMFAEDAHVFATSVTENLRVVRAGITDAQARAALEAVGLDDWVASLLEGADTMLGPDGTTISGGERRRLLLARAVLRRAPLTLLDEPTEHLDPARGDDLLHRLLDHTDHSLIPAGHTAVVVTHRQQAIPPGTDVLRIGEDGTCTLEEAT